MLQIFVHKDWANDASADIVSHASGDRVSGQTRIFMHPDVFLDASKSRMYHYCAIPELCSAETKAGGLTRGSMIIELRGALQPITADLAKLWKNIDQNIHVYM